MSAENTDKALEEVKAEVPAKEVCDLGCWFHAHHELNKLVLGTNKILSLKATNSPGLSICMQTYHPAERRRIRSPWDLSHSPCFRPQLKFSSPPGS
jgi:hypothetical protein